MAREREVARMLHRVTDQKQELQFIIEIEPLRNSKGYQKKRFLGYAGKVAKHKKK